MIANILKIREPLPLLCIFFLSLYDFYHESFGPIFVYFGYIIALALTFREFGRYFNEALLFVLLGFGYYMVSGLGINLTYIAFAVGLTVSIQLGQNLGRSSMHYIAIWILRIHVSLFYILYFAAQIAGQYISVQEVLGLMEQRTNFEAMYRPCGVFFEPNSYCVFILLSLVAIKSTGAIPVKTFLFSIVSLIISKSLWGVAIVPISILMFPLKRSILTAVFSLFVIVFAVFNLLQDQSILGRYTNVALGDEQSFEIRIGDVRQWLQRTSPTGEGFDFVDWQSPSIFGAWLLIKSGWMWSILYLGFNVFYLRINRYMVLALIALLFTQPPLTTAFYHVAIVCSGGLLDSVSSRNGVKQII